MKAIKREKLEEQGWKINCWDINSQFVATKGRLQATGLIEEGTPVSVLEFNKEDEPIGKIQRMSEEEFFKEVKQNE